MKKVLITGITGFAGSFLAEHLLSRSEEIELYGTYVSDKSVENVAGIKDRLKLNRVDLTDFSVVEAFINEVKPDEVYHLAALPSAAESFKKPALFLQNNINAQLHLLEAMRIQDLQKTRIIVVGSSEIYGLVKSEDLPIDEDTPLRPVSPYGVSKIVQDYLGLQYYLAHNLQVIRVRPFGHAGPRLSEQMAISAFAKKISEIEKGKREPVLTVGNLNSRRDLTDVRDVVRAYRMLMDKGVAGEAYNIGSGQSYKIGDLLDKLLSLSKTHIEVKEDESLLRPNDIPELRCDVTKFQTLTGWKPEIEIEKTLEDTLNYWREQI